MNWIYDGQIQQSLTIPFIAAGTPKEVSIRLTSEEGEILSKAYLCLLLPDFVGHVWGRIGGTTKWYKIGGIWDSECFLGTIDEWSFIDIDIKIDLPADTVSGAYRLPFIALHGDDAHGPNRNFCALEAEDNSPLWGDDEFETPLWTGSQGGCPGYEIGSNCGVPVYGHAVPAASIAQYNVVTTYLDNGAKKMKLATPSDLGSATVVGIMIDEVVEVTEAVGCATAQSEDGRYIYEHGGQEVNSSGTLLDVWHPEIRVYDTQTGIWRDIGTCGESKQRDHVMFIYEDKLYIFGGNGGGNNDGTGQVFYDSFYRFDLTTLQCTKLTDAPSERAGADYIIYGTEVHFIGGWNSNGPVLSVDYVEMTTGVWGTVEYPVEPEPVPWPGPIPDPWPYDTTPPEQNPDDPDDPVPVVIVTYPVPPNPFTGFPSGWSLLWPCATGLTVAEASRNWTQTAVNYQMSHLFSAAVNGVLFSWYVRPNQIESYEPPNWGWTDIPEPHNVLKVFGQEGWVTWPTSANWPEELETWDQFGRLTPVVYNRKVYVANPYEDDGTAMYIFDTLHNSWTKTESTAPEFGQELGTGGLQGAQSYGTKIYFWGTGLGGSLAIFIFNTSNNTWDQTIHEIEEVYVATYGPNGGISNNYLYVVDRKIHLTDFSTTTIPVNLGGYWVPLYYPGDVATYTSGSFVKGGKIYLFTHTHTYYDQDFCNLLVFDPANPSVRTFVSGSIMADFIRDPTKTPVYEGRAPLWRFPVYDSVTGLLYVHSNIEEPQLLGNGQPDPLNYYSANPRYVWRESYFVWSSASGVGAASYRTSPTRLVRLSDGSYVDTAYLGATPRPAPAPQPPPPRYDPAAKGWVRSGYPTSYDEPYNFYMSPNQVTLIDFRYLIFGNKLIPVNLRM